MSQPDEGHFFQLPLVNLHRGVSDLVEKAFIAGKAGGLFGKLRGTYALGAFAQNQDSSSRLHDMLGGGEALDGLVEGQVQGDPGGAGDDRIGQSGELLERSGAQKLDSCSMGGHWIAGEDA